MDLPTFLEQLAKTPPDVWYTNDVGELRDTRGRCPIERLADLDPGDHEDAFLDLGLSSQDALKIMNAADACGDLDLRRQLLAVTVERAK